MRNVLYEYSFVSDENDRIYSSKTPDYIRIEGLDINRCKAYMIKKESKYAHTEEEVVFDSRESLYSFMEEKGFYSDTYKWMTDKLRTTFLLTLVINGGITFCSSMYPGYTNDKNVAVVGGILESLPPMYTVVEWGKGYNKRMWVTDLNFTLAEYGIGSDWRKYVVPPTPAVFDESCLERLKAELASYPVPEYYDSGKYEQ